MSTEDFHCPSKALTDAQALALASSIVNDIVTDVVDYAEVQAHWLQFIPSDRSADFFNRSPRALWPLFAKANIRLEQIPDHKGDAVKRIYQVKGIRQRVPNQCGYFAVFNSIHAFLAMYCKNEDQAMEFVRLLQTPAYFIAWQRHWENILLAHVKELEAAETKGGIGIYPWNEAYVKSGVLERPFMEHILRTDPVIQTLRTLTHADFDSFPDITTAGIKFNGVPVAAMLRMKAGLESVLHPDREGASHAFIVGQTNHWVTILTSHSKQPTTAEEKRLAGPTTLFQEVVLLDSRNSFILGKTEEQILDIVAHRSRRTIIGNDTWSQMRRQFYQQSMQDTQFTTELLHRCLSGYTDVVAELTTMNFTAFCSHYTHHTEHVFEDKDRAVVQHHKVVVVHDHKSKLHVHSLSFGLGTSSETLLHRKSIHTEWLTKLQMWLENYYPPPVLELSLCLTIDRMRESQVRIPPNMLELLERWRQAVEHRLEAEQSQVSTVQRFYSVITILGLAIKSYQKKLQENG